MSTEQQAVYGVGEETITSPKQAATEASAPGVLTPDRLRVWGGRAAFSLVDQGLTSGAGFAVNLLLARWILPEVYGAFAVAFAGFLFVSGFHNVLLLEPMSVFGPSRYPERLPEYFRAQLVIHMILVGALSAITLLAGVAWWRVSPASPLPNAILGAGLALPFLLLQWLARRMCYVAQRPTMAVTGSALYVTIIAVGLFALKYFAALGPFSAFLLMGAGSLLASILLAGQLVPLSREGLGNGVSWQTVVRENWTYGRWLVGSTVLYSISSQTQTFLVAGIVGLSAAGILRAMQIPSLIMTQVVTAAGLLVLPNLSYDFGRRSIKRLSHKAMLVSFGLGGPALCFVAALWLLARPTEHLLFAGKYSEYSWLMAMLGLVPVCTGLSMGCAMALRAIQRPQFDLLANAVAAPVGLLSALAFIHRWGLAGAAASIVLTIAVMGVVTFVSYRVSLSGKTLMSRMQEPVTNV
jgi:O-antigen/teichoic acid export membrane protein